MIVWKRSALSSVEENKIRVSENYTVNSLLHGGVHSSVALIILSLEIRVDPDQMNRIHTVLHAASSRMA